MKTRGFRGIVKGTTMSNLNVKALATDEPNAKASFFRRLWQGILQLDEAMQFDSHSYLSHRVTELERQLEALRAPGKNI
jgi:hypothetical protein